MTLAGMQAASTTSYESRFTIKDKTALEVRKRPDLNEVLEKVRELKARVPLDFKFDRDDANER